MMMRTDLLTNEEFNPKRNNQKFACPENRIKYHNIIANELRRQFAYINKPLHKNMRILMELMAGITEKEIHKQYLLGKGFEFGIYTHLNEIDGKKQFAIYDFTVIPVENNNIKILRND